MDESHEGLNQAGAVKAWVGLASGQLDHDRRLMWWVATLEHTLAWFEGMVLTYWGIKRIGREWRLIVKAERRIPGKAPEHRVCFYNATTMFATFAQLAYGIKRGDIRWLEDRYPPDMGS